MLLDLMNQHLSLLQQGEFFLRILAACLCGALIGVERSHRLKEAGVRTHLLVACTAAVMIIVSKYGFSDLTNEAGETFFGTRGADPARIAAQVVSGISFLCAGVIFRNGSTVKGLTTAAGLWATAGIGLSFGAGMYLLGIFATLLVLAVQIIMHKMPVGNDAYQTNRIEITVNDNPNFRAALSKQFSAWHAQVVETCVTQNADGTTSYAMTVKMYSSVTHDEIFSFLDRNSCVVSFSESVSA